MNEPLFVPETIFVNDLLAAFRNTNNQMAILLMDTVALLVLLPSRTFWKKSLVRLTTETDKTSVEVREIGENTFDEGAMTLTTSMNILIQNLRVMMLISPGYYLTGCGGGPSQLSKSRTLFSYQQGQTPRIYQ